MPTGLRAHPPPGPPPMRRRRAPVLATTLDQDLSDYVGPCVEFVPSPAASAVALAPRMTCLQVRTPDALTYPSDKKGHL
jgi:hypothetical protein